MRIPVSAALFFLVLTTQAQSGLVGYYSFCNCNANDNSGNGLHGTIKGSPECIPGQRGEGLLFNQTPGSNGCGQNGGEYVQLPAIGPVWENGFTVCAWVRFDNLAYYERIIDLGNSSGDSGGMPVLFGREGSSNNLMLESWISSNGSTNRSTGRLVAPNAITNGSIEYYCATISGDSMKIYVNGVLKAKKKGHPIKNVSRTNNFIGRSNWCFNDPDFKGFMDEVRIYNRALSESEINSLYLQTPTFGEYQHQIYAGMSVPLSVTGGISYAWSPAESLSDSTTANPVASPSETTTYKCRITMQDGCIYEDSLTIEVLRVGCESICQGQLGENIFPNGDFGSGIPNIVSTDPGTAPGYTYTTNPPPNDGFYTITNNTTNWGSFAAYNWINILDNGPEPNGYMMIVNATYSPGLFYEKTVAVCENTLYEFSIDVISIMESHKGGIKPNISFLIDGIALCETGDIPTDETWRTIRFSFYTLPGQTSVKLALRNNAPGGNGNDIGLDNISFRACGPDIVLPQEVRFCLDEPLMLQPDISHSPYQGTAVYQWQVLTGGQWQDLPGAVTPSLTVNQPVDSAQYRLLIAGSTANLTSLNCRVASQPVMLKRITDLQPALGTIAPACAGDQNGSAAVVCQLCTPPFDVLWNTGDTTLSMTGLPSGLYAVTVTDSLGCTGYTSVMLSEPLPLVSEGIKADISCAGMNDGQIHLTVSGGTLPCSYQWNNGSNTQELSDLTAGTYTVTVTDAHLCTATQVISITEPPPLSAQTTQTPVSCTGSGNGSIQTNIAGGTAPYTYIWNNGVNTPALANLSGGVYSVSIADANDCQLVLSVPLMEPDPLSVQGVTNNLTCYQSADGSIQTTPSGGTGGYSWSWNNGGAGSSLQNLPAGLYELTVTDAANCTLTQTFELVQPPLLFSTGTVTNVSCHGMNNGSIQMNTTGGTLPYQFTWNNGSISPDQQNLAAGTYQLTVSDQNGCFSTHVFDVTEPDQLEAFPAAQDISCSGLMDGTVTSSPAGGTPPYQYAWSNGSTSASQQNLGAGTYLLTLTDANGCSVNNFLAVAEPDPLSMQSGYSDIQCHGNATGSIQISATGGVPPLTYLWNTGDSTPELSNLTAGSYIVTVSDANQCTTEQTITLAQPAQLLLQFDVDEITCYGNTDGRLETAVSGGQPPYQFLWNNGSNNGFVQSLGAGEYEVTVTDNAECTLTGKVTLSQPPALGVQGVQTNLDCFEISNGSAVAIPGGGTPPYSWLWNTGSVQESLNSLAAGVYVVTVTDARNCTSTRIYNINQPDQLQLAHSVAEPDCHSENNGSIQVTPSGGIPPYAFNWNNGQTTGEINGLAGGLYLLTVTDNHQCTETATFSLPSVTIPQTSLGADLQVELGEELILAAHSNLPDAQIQSYTWEGDAGYLNCPDCRRFRFFPLESGCQQVLVLTPEGCEATDEVCYKVTARRNIYFPNVFSPNADGQNDYFHPSADASVRIIRYLSVFDRWGEQVFHRENMEPNDPFTGWDGQYRGEVMNNAVFVWVAEVVFIDGQIRTYKGDVTLLR